MADNYDVIIIGTGAGGGTLAHRLAATGKRILMLERGGLAAAGGRELGRGRGLRGRPLHLAGQLVRQGRQGVSAAGPLQRRWRDETLRRGTVPLAGARLRRAAHHDGSRRRGPSAMPISSPITRRPSRSTRSTVSAASTRPNRPRARHYPFPPVSNEPRIQQLASDMRSIGLHPFHSPNGILLDETDPHLSACIRCSTCDGFPCMVQAKADAEVIGDGPRSRTAT